LLKNSLGGKEFSSPAWVINKKEIEMARNNSLIVAGVIAASLPVTAHAAEFDGPYVGAQVGWTSNQIRDPETSLGTIPMDDDQQSLTGGVYAGYDRRVAEKVVVGVEGGLDFANNDEVESATAGGIFTIDPKYSFDLTARAGYLVNPNTLVYARGGYTNARVKTTVDTTIGAENATDNRDGWLLGAGVERQFMPNASARVEYRYSDLSEGDGDFDRHRVLAGLSYRF
jgi:outer membrane immunogenic protein